MIRREESSTKGHMVEAARCCLGRRNILHVNSFNVTKLKSGGQRGFSELLQLQVMLNEAHVVRRRVNPSVFIVAQRHARE